MALAAQMDHPFNGPDSNVAALPYHMFRLQAKRSPTRAYKGRKGISNDSGLEIRNEEHRLESKSHVKGVDNDIELFWTGHRTLGTETRLHVRLYAPALTCRRDLVLGKTTVAW
jgi:hypothetical protein